MITERIVSLFLDFIGLLSFNLPELPADFHNLLDMLFDGMITGLGYISIFIDLEFWLSCATFMLILHESKHIYNAVIWVINWFPTMDPNSWK